MADKQDYPRPDPPAGRDAEPAAREIDERMRKGYESGTSPADLLAEFKATGDHQVDLEEIAAAYRDCQASGQSAP